MSDEKNNKYDLEELINLQSRSVNMSKELKSYSLIWNISGVQYEKEGRRLLQESVELKKIFSAILLKS